MNLKKFRYGSASLGITALVIAAVILLNVAVGALFSNSLWFLDETSEKIYRLDDSFKNFLQRTLDEANDKRAQNGEEDVKVDIIFCADPDMLKGSTRMRYVYYTALALQKAFPDTIEVSTTNVWTNPSSVDPYRTNSYSSIYQTNVIIASGSEFRVTDLDYYYVTDTGTGEVWAYHGEKKLVQAIMAVTKAEAPICGITTNHGEPFATEEGKAEYSRLIEVVEDAGYDVQYFDLAKDEIPEDCRLILTFDPQTDFLSEYGTEDAVSEIEKLDDFLAQAYSYMVFVDADTPELPNLEMLLEEWGITFDRYADPSDSDTVLGNYRINADSAVDSLGNSIIGEYEPEGYGGGITKNMRKYGGSPKVVFGNAMSISYSKSYQAKFVMADAEKGTEAYSYGYYARNSHYRNIYDMFRSGEDSVAYAVKNGLPLTDAEGNPLDPVDTQGDFKLMTITCENRTIGEGQGYTQVNDASYVCAVGSTDFASDQLLSSNAYANTDVLLETLRSIGKEVVPVGLLFEPMYDDEMTEASASTGAVYYTKAGNIAWTVFLALIPAVACATAGAVILLRRRFGA